MNGIDILPWTEFPTAGGPNILRLIVSDTLLWYISADFIRILATHSFSLFPAGAVSKKGNCRSWKNFLESHVRLRPVAKDPE